MTDQPLNIRAYAGETDLEPIVAFLNMVEEYDRTHEWISLSELREELSEPGADPARDIRLYTDEQEQLIGFAQLYVAADTADNDGFLWFTIHPAQRNGQIEPLMFAWAEEQLRERGRVRLRVAARDSQTDRQALFERHGFVPVRYFQRMRRALTEPIAAPAFPPGYQLRDGNHDPQTWADLYNESFVDHFNFHRHTAAQVRHWQSDPDYRPELNLVAVAPDGTMAAFAWCHINPEHNQRNGRLDGTIGVLGTRRGQRRIGLGRAMLLAALHRLRDAGMTSAELGVDSTSPTGANALYESAGFVTAFTRVLYSRDLSRGNGMHNMVTLPAED